MRPAILVHQETVNVEGGADTVTKERGTVTPGGSI